MGNIKEKSIKFREQLYSGARKRKIAKMVEEIEKE